uniref:FERM domain-containing protein n=2 Tax=Biomphalaria glabrata TaxID=6526 RepID=A0A2C9JYE1_BIOGL
MTDNGEPSSPGSKSKMSAEYSLDDRKISEDRGPNKMNDKAAQKPVSKPSGKTVTCNVFLLDGENVEIPLDKNDVGRVLLDKVCTHLDLIERDYFGLTYTDDRGPSHLKYWLNLDKKISKQKKRGAWVFEFALKFYPPDPTHLRESLTRWLVVLQVRRDLLSGRLPCTFNTYALLGSYNVQADIGEFDSTDHGHSWDYIKDMTFAPTQTPELLDKIAELHKLHKGQTPDEAEKNFLDNAKKLAMYGVDLHKAKDSDNNAIMIGVCCSGILVYREKLRINRFVWPKILKLSYKRNHFYIKIRPGELERNETTIMFKLDNHRLAKRLWKTCVEHHAFFRLREAEKPSNNVSFPRFGSKFRYSGRTLYQTRQNAALLDRPPPFFERSQPARNTMPDSARRSQSLDEPLSQINLDGHKRKLSSDNLQRLPYDAPDKKNLEPDSIPLCDEYGKPLFDKPVYNEEGKIIFDEKGKPYDLKDAPQGSGKPLLNEDGKPLFDEKGKPLFFKDGHRVVGKPLYDNDGKPIFDRNNNPLYGKPVFGVPIYDQKGKPVCDEDGNPLYVRPIDGQPICDSRGQPLYDKKGKPLHHKDGIPFFDKSGDHLHGQPVYDKDDNPIYNNDGKGVFDRDGRQFYDDDGKPVLDKSGSPLYLKPAYDRNSKPLSNKNGQPLYGKNVKPLYWEDVYDKDGKPYFGKLYDGEGNVHPILTSLKASDTPDKNAVALLDDIGKPLYHKPVFDPDGRPLYDAKGKSLYPKDSSDNGKPLVGEDGKAILDKDGKPLYYRDGQKVMGLPLFDETGLPVCDKDGKQLYGQPIFGVPTVDKNGSSVYDVDNNPLFSRPLQGEPVRAKDGKPLVGKDGKPLVYNEGRGFYDKKGNPLHGIPLYDKDDLPVYNNDAKPVYDKEGNLFYDEDGNVMADSSGKPLYTKPACDPSQKPLQDKDGKPLFGKNFRPLYWDQVYSKDGKPFDGKLYTPDGKLHPYATDQKAKEVADADFIPIYDANGKPLFDKPVYKLEGKPLFDDKGKALYPDEKSATAKPLTDDAGKPLLDKKGKPLFYKDGQQVFGKPLYDEHGKGLFDKNGRKLYGKPVYGVPYTEKDGKPAHDSDGNPLFARPHEGEPVLGKDGKQLFDRDGRPLAHQEATPFYDKEGNHLHGKPLLDKDGLPIYNKDGRPVYDKDGKLFYDSEGRPNVEKSGKPLYSKPAFDQDGKPIPNKDGKQTSGKDFRPVYWEDIYDEDGMPFFDVAYSKDGKPHPYTLERTGPKLLKAHLLNAGLGLGKVDRTGVVGDEREIENRNHFMPLPKPVKASKDTLKSNLSFFHPDATSTVARSKVPPPVAPKGNHSLDDSFGPLTVATEKVKYNPNYSDVPLSSRNIPLVKTEIRTVKYEHDNCPPDLEDGILVSAHSHSSRLQTIETVTYRTERDGVEETRYEHKVVLSNDEEDDYDFDAALVEAIRSVTEFNPDMSVERIECVQQLEDVGK